MNESPRDPEEPSSDHAASTITTVTVASATTTAANDSIRLDVFNTYDGALYRARFPSSSFHRCFSSSLVIVLVNVVSARSFLHSAGRRSGHRRKYGRDRQRPECAGSSCRLDWHALMC